MTASCSRSVAAVPLTLILVVALSNAQQDQPGWDDAANILLDAP